MRKTTLKRLILLDSHAILHRAYHGLPDFSSSKGEPTGALYGLSSMLIKIIADLKPDYIVATFDLPKPTYRHEAYKEYKAGRAKTDDALVAQIKRSREIFEAFGIPMYDKEGFEADDMLGTIVQKVKNKKDIEVVIASGDMDTLQLVSGKKVQVYTLKKGIQDTILYDEEAVKKRFGFEPRLLPDYKGLRGDPSDNIIGIKGIGEKTGGLLVQTFGTVEEMYKKLKKSEKPFLEAGLTPRIITLIKENEEEALFSKTLATIRRDAPIDFEVPEKTWRENLETAKVVKLFAELEFRSLSARLTQVLAGKGGGQMEARAKSSERAPEVPVMAGGTPASLFGAGAQEHIEPEKLTEAGLMLWLVNSNISNPNLEDILQFTGASTFDEAVGILQKQMKEKNVERVFTTIEKPLIPVVKRIKERGICVDISYLKQLSSQYHKTLAQLEKDIWKQAGSEFNINSPKQLGEILFEKLGLKAKNQKKTGTGALSTKESELEKLRESHTIIPLILEHRELSKLLGTYIDTIPNAVAPDGRLHADLIQAGTTTGRMSSENPNLQNIPNKTELGRNIRHAFIAGKGYTLVAFDYSQMELRIAAFLSGDKKLIEIFKDGIDVHTAVASEVFGVGLAEVLPEMRRRAKVINFGVMYGMGINALRLNLGTGVSREEAQKFYNDYFAKFAGLATYLEHTKAEARRTGFTETFFGRRRYFPGITSKLPFIRASAERMAINAPVQGTGADLVKIAMSRVDEAIEKAGLRGKVFLLLQVHDELVFEVAKDVVTDFIKCAKPIMENVVDPKETAGVVCTVEAKIGDNWGDMKPEK